MELVAMEKWFYIIILLTSIKQIVTMISLENLPVRRDSILKLINNFFLKYSLIIQVKSILQNLVNSVL